MAVEERARTSPLPAARKAPTSDPKGVIDWAIEQGLHIVDPLTKQAYTRDPRNVARKAEAYLKTTGIADTCYIGPECEFYIFNDIRFHQDSRSGYYFIDSDEGIWNS